MPFLADPKETIARWWWLPMLVGAIGVWGWAWAAEWPTLRLTADWQQTRLDTPLPAPKGEQWLEQSFISRQAGLSELELLLVRYQQANGTAADGRLHLTLRDAQTGEVIAAQSWHSRQTTHNQPLLVRFAPQPHSAGRTYVVRLTGEGDNPLSVWGYTLNPSADLTLTTHQLETAAQTMRLVTRTQMQWAAEGRMVLAEMRHQALPLLLTLLFMTLPGLAWLAWQPAWRAALGDGLAQWGTAVAIGPAVWALLWLWLTTLGWRVTSGLLTLLLAGLLVAAGWGMWRHWVSHPPRWPSLNSLAFGLFLLGVWALRLLAVRGLAFLPWVDASRHGLITAVMRDTGLFLTEYTPYLPVSQSLYHVGFHALPASVQLLTGEAWPLALYLLWLMQWLSTLLPLTIYAGTWWLTKHRGAAWLAAFWAAVPLLFPAYYTTWGRLTQLTGMLLLPVLVAATWWLWFGGRKGEDGAEERAEVVVKRPWLLAAVLAAGVFLIHFRVFVIYLPLAGWLGLVWLVQAGWKRWSGQPVHLPAAPLLGASGLGLLLVAPRAWYLWQLNATYTTPTGGGGGDYNAFPSGYLTTGWEQGYWVLAAVLLGWVALAAVRRTRSDTTTMPPIPPVWFYPVWLVLLGVGTAGQLIRLPILLPTLNLNSVYIALFVPQAMFLGTAGAWLVGDWRRWPWLWQVVGYTAVGGGWAAVALYGSFQQVNVLNPSTILAQPADMAGMAWVAENTPPTAKIGHSSWLWLGGTWAGTDGGAWLTPLTGRPTTTPPIDYIYSAELVHEVAAFNRWAEEVGDWSDPTTAVYLQQQGVTHLFIGQRGGFLDPAELVRNPALTLRFAHEGVYVFEVGGDREER